MEDEIINVTCNACGAVEEVDTWKDVKYHRWHRKDFYGLTTGMFCDYCYEHNYPFRKDAYYDPSYAGERMDDDY